MTTPPRTPLSFANYWRDTDEYASECGPGGRYDRGRLSSASGTPPQASAATLCQWTRQAATVAASVVRGGTSTQDTHERVAALLANLLALPADMRAWLLGLPYTPEPIINPDECDPHGMPRPQ